MRRLYPRLKQRLAQRPDTEHGQAIVRIVLITLILLYVLMPGPRHDLPPAQYHGVLAIVLTGLTLSLGLFGWLLWRPGRSDPRRVAGMDETDPFCANGPGGQIGTPVEVCPRKYV